MNQVIVFDLDGTLVDLPVEIEAVREEIAEVFRAFGYEEPIKPILQGINRAAASVARNDEEIVRLIITARRILDRAEVAAAKIATVRPGAIESLNYLKEQNIPLALVTNNSRACVPPALARLGCSVDDFVVSTRDDVRRPKPAPDGLIRVAGSLAKEGGTMWFVGDSPVDISAAVAANPQVPGKVKAVAVTGPRSSRQQLRFAGPSTIVDSLEEALHYIVGEINAERLQG